MSELDIVAILLFAIGTSIPLYIAFKPVWDTMKRDELEREQKHKNNHAVHSV